MAKWLPPNGFTGKVHHMDAKVGGTYKMSFTNFTTGHSHSFGGEYLELVPHERIRYTDRFDDPNLPGEMQTTITLKKVSCGTELNIVQEGHAGGHPARGVLSRLARVAHSSGEARRGRDSGLDRGPAQMSISLLLVRPICEARRCPPPNPVRSARYALSFAKTSSRLSGRRPMLSRQAKERLGDCRPQGGQQCGSPARNFTGLVD